MNDRPAPAHRFKVGQTVTLNPNRFELRAPRDTFKVLKLMPIEGGLVSYRVQSLRDRHERIVNETELH